MTERPWPLGQSTRPRSQAALLTATAPELRLWLTNSVLSWVEAETDEERVRAFAPLVFSPREEPARQFANWWDRAAARARMSMEEGVAEAIEAFDPGAYPHAAILLLQIGAHFGCARGIAPLYALLAKPLRLSEGARRDFAESVAFFALNRATAQELRDLAYRLRDLDQLSPVAAIELLVRAAVTQGAEVLDDLILLAPELTEDDHPVDHPERADLRRYWANALVDAAGAGKAYVFALTAQVRGWPELREALERFRLELMRHRRGEAESIEDRLHDKILGYHTLVDLRAFPQAVVETPGAVAATEKRFGGPSLDDDLVLEKFDPEDS